MFTAGTLEFFYKAARVEVATFLEGDNIFIDYNSKKTFRQKKL